MLKCETMDTVAGNFTVFHDGSGGISYFAVDGEVDIPED